MSDRRRLYLVPAARPPAPAPELRVSLATFASDMRTALPNRQRPPIKPRRPAAAVRKSLRAALAVSGELVDSVAFADARVPAKARKAVHCLDAHAKRVARLVDELRHAVECEARYHLWRRGKSYVE